MIIIVEGIDRVGKTTLCNMLEKRYKNLLDIKRFRDDTRYAHGHTDMDVNTEKINTLMNLIENDIVRNVILDRFHLTEFVYGAVEREYGNADMYDIDKRLSEVDKRYNNMVVLIYVVPTDIKASSEEHGRNLERHLKLFNNFYNGSFIENKIKVDYNTLGQALQFIDKLLV